MEDKGVRHINSVTFVEDLLSELVELLGRSKKVLSKKMMTHDQGQEMAKHVTSIRLLITELCEAENRFTISKDHKEAIKKARESFFELEGMVKEIRNSLIV